jgi:hypothetical protein
MVMHRHRGLYAAVMSACIALAACGASSTTTTGSRLSSSPDLLPDSALVDVTGVSIDARGMVITFATAPPFGNQLCVTGVDAVVTETSAHAVYVSVRGAPTTTFCSSSDSPKVTLTLSEPLAGRDLVVDTNPYTSEGAGTMRRCDARLGCHPPTFGCDQPWIDQALRDADTPPRSKRNVEGCDGHYLVMTIDVGTSACPANDASACDGPSRALHWFFRAIDDRWRAITATTSGGCADVIAAEPLFPTALCTDLAPTR